MNRYNIEAAFEKIENELIASMMRNFERHKAEEVKEGFNWDMWQAKQLEALAEYKKHNKKIYPDRFNKINKNIRKIIREAYKRGELKEEVKILKAIEKGFNNYSKSDTNFFIVNNRKLDALIQATINDIQKAEYAVLRMSEDKYRRAIFDAQIYANTGAGTYEKAVDMAVKDMLYAGLNCVEYKNGARHTLANYSKMAIRTAAKRAYLQGEGEKRKEWGISLVILNKRSNACPLCLPFVGKVLIDDVWSGGKQEDGEYMLMSKAIEHGLYHPNCKDSHTTYFKELDDEPEVKYSKKELEEMLKKTDIENKLNHSISQEEKYKRLAKYSLSDENKKLHKARASKWEEKKEKSNKVLDEILIKEPDKGIIKYKVVDEELEKDLQAKSNKYWKELLGSEQNALYDYTGAYYGTVNRHLQGLRSSDSWVVEYTEDLIKNIDSSMKNKIIEDNVVLYRGVSKDDFEDWKVSDIKKTFLSTSIRKDVAESFGDGYLIEIHAPSNTRAFYLGDNSMMKLEKEMLLGRNQKYKIVSSTENTLVVELVV